MIPRSSWLLLFPALGLFAFACGGGQGGNGTSFVSNCTKDMALQTTTSKGGAYTFYLCDAATPAIGFNGFTYLIVDQAGVPQDGLTLGVQPWMPYMNHGSPGNGDATVTPSGTGQYQLSNVVFQMPGEWELRTSISAPTPDSANPQFNIN